LAIVKGTSKRLRCVDEKITASYPALLDDPPVEIALSDFGCGDPLEIVGMDEVIASRKGYYRTLVERFVGWFVASCATEFPRP
jgi:hypothetical protein